MTSVSPPDMSTGGGGGVGSTTVGSLSLNRILGVLESLDEGAVAEDGVGWLCAAKVFNDKLTVKPLFFVAAGVESDAANAASDVGAVVLTGSCFFGGCTTVVPADDIELLFALLTTTGAGAGFSITGVGISGMSTGGFVMASSGKLDPLAITSVHRLGAESFDTAAEGATLVIIFSKILGGAVLTNSSENINMRLGFMFSAKCSDLAQLLCRLVACTPASFFFSTYFDN